MNKRIRAASIFLAISLVGCAVQSEIMPTLSLSTQTSGPAFAPTPTVSPTESVSLAITPTMISASDGLIQLPSLSLPEFDARYSTGDIALSQDGKFMAVVSRNKLEGNKSVWVWNANALSQSLAGYQVNLDDLWSAAFSLSGSQLAIGGKGKIITLDWKTGNINDIIELPDSEAVQLEFVQDKSLVSSSFSNKVTVWDLSRREARYSVDSTVGFYQNSFAVSPDGKTLVTGDVKGIQFWDIATGQKTGFREGPDSGIGIAPATVFSDKGTFLASTGCSKFIFEGCSSGKILIWKSDSNTPSIISGVHSSWINVLAFSPDQEMLASAGGPASIKLIRLADGKIITAPSLNKPGQMPPKDPLATNDMIFFPDGRTLAVSTNDGIQFLDVAKMSWAPNLRFLLGVGYSYMITRKGNNLNLRMEPSLRGQVIRILQGGQWLTVIDGPKMADGFIWWKIRLVVDNAEGWVVEMPEWIVNPP